MDESIRTFPLFSSFPIPPKGTPQPAESVQFTVVSVDSMNTMWCQPCGQDVPGAIADGTSEYRCPRCRNLLRQSDRQLRIGIDDEHPAGEDTSVAEEEIESPDVDREQEVQSPPAYDGWELEQRLKHIERVLAAEGLAAEGLPAEGLAADGKPAGESSGFIRLDSAHGSLGRPHDRPRGGIFSRPGVFLRTVVWSTLLIGVMTLACGSFLMGWSMFSSRADLWSIGFPIALAGAISLFVALVVQIDRLLHDNRHTAAELDKLAVATSHMGNRHHSPSDAFYSHIVGGANPQLLLSDLKSQLDLLADKISKRETS